MLAHTQTTLIMYTKKISTIHNRKYLELERCNLMFTKKSLFSEYRAQSQRTFFSCSFNTVSIFFELKLHKILLLLFASGGLASCLDINTKKRNRKEKHSFSHFCFCLILNEDCAIQLVHNTVGHLLSNSNSYT